MRRKNINRFCLVGLAEAHLASWQARISKRREGGAVKRAATQGEYSRLEYEKEKDLSFIRS